MRSFHQAYEQLHAQDGSQRVYELEAEVEQLRRELELQWRANHHQHCEHHDHDPNFDCRWPEPEGLSS